MPSRCRHQKCTEQNGMDRNETNSAAHFNSTQSSSGFHIIPFLAARKILFFSHCSRFQIWKSVVLVSCQLSWAQYSTSEVSVAVLCVALLLFIYLSNSIRSRNNQVQYFSSPSIHIRIQFSLSRAFVIGVRPWKGNSQKLLIEIQEKKNWTKTFATELYLSIWMNVVWFCEILIFILRNPLQLNVFGDVIKISRVIKLTFTHTS